MKIHWALEDPGVNGGLLLSTDKAVHQVEATPLLWTHPCRGTPMAGRRSQDKAGERVSPSHPMTSSPTS